jgi:hypothetical protein
MKEGKYTAKELTEIAGFEKVEFGKIRVRIGGLRGIVSSDHLITIQEEGELDVLVGKEKKTI